MLLQDKVAIITGGSRGIGYATAQAFLRQGAKVALCASRQENADKAVAALQEEFPDGDLLGIAPDLADYDSVKAAFDGVETTWGRIDILVNNAGVSESTPFTAYTEETFDRVLDLNVKGVYNCARAVCDGMIARHSGVILNTSSMVSISGQPGGVAYPPSKFAVNGFTLSLARELGPQGIRVNAVAPGIIDTVLSKKAIYDQTEYTMSMIPLRRAGKPEEIGDVIVCMASDRFGYMTGAVVKVDGGKNHVEDPDLPWSHPWEE